MAQMQKLEAQVELNCSADKLFEMMVSKKSDFPNVCSNIVGNTALNQNDWTSVGSTRKWDFIIDGKSQYIVEKVEEIDEKNKIIRHAIIEGDMLNSHYKKLATHMQIISKENSCCMVKLTFEYEKLYEDAPEPRQFMEFGICSTKDVASHIVNAN